MTAPAGGFAEDHLHLASALAGQELIEVGSGLGDDRGAVSQREIAFQEFVVGRADLNGHDGFVAVVGRPGGETDQNQCQGPSTVSSFRTTVFSWSGSGPRGRTGPVGAIRLPLRICRCISRLRWPSRPAVEGDTRLDGKQAAPGRRNTAIVITASSAARPH